MKCGDAWHGSESFEQGLNARFFHPLALSFRHDRPPGFPDRLSLTFSQPVADGTDGQVRQHHDEHLATVLILHRQVTGMPGSDLLRGFRTSKVNHHLRIAQQPGEEIEVVFGLGAEVDRSREFRRYRPSF